MIVGVVNHIFWGRGVTEVIVLKHEKKSFSLDVESRLTGLVPI